MMYGSVQSAYDIGLRRRIPYLLSPGAVGKRRSGGSSVKEALETRDGRTGEVDEVACEARYVGQRLARLCAIARVSPGPDPRGFSVDDLAVVADALQGWADQLERVEH
jgi:hypothetical protein